INLTCSVPWACEQGTPPTFSWEGPSVSSLGPNITHSSVLTLTPRPQDHGTNLTCQVKFPAAGVTTERTIQLNVTWAGKEAWVPGLGLLSAGVIWGAIGGAAPPWGRGWVGVERGDPGLEGPGGVLRAWDQDGVQWS
uniref:Ig-like domain-containing protein n=1 Tax=Spermophilus dauricus TaxID=99837 RepID=A0A8C9QTH6_SPEDA